MKVRLTDRFLATCQTKTRVEYWDTLVPGFGVRVSPRGTKTFWIRTRHHGERIRIKIGRYPSWSLHDARAEAQTILGALGRGMDPRRQHTISFADLVRQYLSQSRMGEVVSADEIRRICEKDLIPAWGTRPAGDIRRADVVALLDSIQQRITAHGSTGVAMRNRTHSTASRIFSYGVLLEVIPSNPCLLIPRIPEHERERVLSDNEIRRLWPIWEADCDGGPIFQLLLLTAQRKGEVTRMRWEDLSGDWWTIPKPMSKNNRSNSVYLAATTRAIIEQQDQISDWVFPGKKGDTPYLSTRPALLRYRRQSRIADWRIHDLRRTAATKMVELDIPPRIVEEILNHKQRGITEKYYLRASYRNRVREALTRWENYLLGEIVGMPQSHS